jgi:hypothetical protein
MNSRGEICMDAIKSLFYGELNEYHGFEKYRLLWKRYGGRYRI